MRWKSVFFLKTPMFSCTEKGKGFRMKAPVGVATVLVILLE